MGLMVSVCLSVSKKKLSRSENGMQFQNNQVLKPTSAQVSGSNFFWFDAGDRGKKWRKGAWTFIIRALSLYAQIRSWYDTECVL